jgi:hypothetical protein
MMETDETFERFRHFCPVPKSREPQRMEEKKHRVQLTNDQKRILAEKSTEIAFAEEDKRRREARAKLPAFEVFGRRNLPRTLPAVALDQVKSDTDPGLWPALRRLESAATFQRSVHGIGQRLK